MPVPSLINNNKMKIKTIFTVIALTATTAIWAQNPKFFKKARKVQLTLISYDSKGDITQGQAFSINENGDALAEYDLLKKAEKAVVVDMEGNQYNVTHIMGASSLYNVVKLETTHKKADTMPIATGAQKGETVYIMPICNNDKKAECVIETIAESQEFGEEKYGYYKLSNPIDSRMAGCPVFNANGELLGSIQMPVGDATKEAAYVISAQYGNSLRIGTLDFSNNDLRSIGIPKSLPDEESQASTYLFLYNKQDQKGYEQTIRDYMEKFPNSSIGYIQLAELQVSKKEHKAAEETYAKALQMNTGKDDEIHHSYAKLLYQAGLLDTPPAEGWDMAHALQEATTAYTCNPLPLYTALEGMCLYAMKEYDKSCEKFLAMGQTNMRSAEYFLYASQCKQMLKAPTEEILALQDSAVNCFTKPYPTEAASCLYLRAKTLASLQKFREAVTDMNEYEHLLSGNVNANFLYEREQMEMQCRMFPGALNDIERAVKLQPNEPLLHAESAVVNYRVGQLDEAIASAREAIRLDATFPDAYRILGICLSEKGKKTEAREALLKAKELGDTMADTVLEKIK